MGSSPASMAHAREKVKRWVRDRATRFLESYFKESLGSRHPALTILRRLSAQVQNDLSDLTLAYIQCDHIVILLIQYLAIYNNEHLQLIP